MGCGDVRLLRTTGGVEVTEQERAALNKLTMPSRVRGRMAGQIVIALLLGVLAAFSPSTASAQEIRGGFFDATVDVEGIGANSYPGLSIGGSVPVAVALPVSVYARYNRDYGSKQKLTDYVVPSLQLGVAVRAVSMRNLAASLRLGVIRAYLRNTTLTTPTVGASVTLGGRYGLAASIDYGTNDGVTTIASMMGLYVRF